jgi:hypothetical protein
MEDHLTTDSTLEILHTLRKEPDRGYGSAKERTRSPRAWHSKIAGRSISRTYAA